MTARLGTSARRYAEAAFDIATRDGAVVAWRDQLQRARDALGDERVARALHNAGVPLEERQDLVERLIADIVDRRVVNLVGLLLRRGRIELLPRLVDEFVRLHNEQRGIVTAEVTSAAPLTPSEVDALTARLQERTGGRVELQFRTDPGLLGGLTVRVGDELMDGSVRGRLERLRNQLLATAH